MTVATMLPTGNPEVGSGLLPSARQPCLLRILDRSHPLPATNRSNP